MKYLLEGCLIAVILAVSISPSIAQSAPAASAGALFAGTWEGKMNGLPGISLEIQESSGTVGGSVVFYFQQRSDPNSPWQVVRETAVPMVSPHVEGRTLSFEVQHHVCHGCSELGPNVRFRMTLAGSDEARLWKLDETTDSDKGLELTRKTQVDSPTAQAMQKGVSVELARTDSAVPVPEADNPDALIITVTETGRIYFGIDPVTQDTLAEKLKARPSHDTQTLYIKADARTPYAGVVKVLDAAGAAGVAGVTLLTTQSKTTQAGKVASPDGIEMELARRSPAASK
jgi:biopolymer transport protein ExbD